MLRDNLLLKVAEEVGKRTRSQYEKLLVELRLFSLSTLKDDDEYYRRTKEQLIVDTLRNPGMQDLILSGYQNKYRFSDQLLRQLLEAGINFSELEEDNLPGQKPRGNENYNETNGRSEKIYQSEADNNNTSMSIPNPIVVNITNTQTQTVSSPPAKILSKSKDSKNKTLIKILKIILPVIGLIAVAIIGYMGIKYQTDIPIKVTEIAKASLLKTSQVEKPYLTQTQSVMNTGTSVPLTITPTLTNTITPSLTPTFPPTLTFTPINFSTSDFKSGCISADYWRPFVPSASNVIGTDINNCWLLDNWGFSAKKNIGLSLAENNLPESSLRVIYMVIPEITNIHVQMKINKLKSFDSTKLPYVFIGITEAGNFYHDGQFLYFSSLDKDSVLGYTSVFLSPGIGHIGQFKATQTFEDPQDFIFSREKRNISIKWGSNVYPGLLPVSQNQQAFWIGFVAPGGGSIDALISEFSYSH